MSGIDVELAYLRWYFGLLFPESVPEFAISALEAGYDGRRLRRIAGMNRPTRADLESIIDGMFRELGQSPVTDIRNAGTRLAVKFCQQIVAGEVPPYDGAKQIWRSIYYALQCPEELVTFVGLASEWEDLPELRRKYDREILAAAREFLQKTVN